MIGLKNLLSNFVSATDLFSLSAAFLSFSEVFLRKELCCFKVPNIDFTDFETEVIKVAGTSTVFPFLVLFFFLLFLQIQNPALLLLAATFVQGFSVILIVEIYWSYRICRYYCLLYSKFRIFCFSFLPLPLLLPLARF